MIDSLKKISLADGQWQAELLPEYGANICALRCGRENIIRNAESDEAFQKDHIVYGVAFLLPPDRTIGGSFEFEGVEYRLPVNDSRGLSNLHGMMHDAPFELVAQEKNCAVLRYENHGERYPFPFSVEVKCTLDEGLKVEYDFVNTGTGPMPLLFGLHANFRDLGHIKVPIHKEMPMNMETLVPDDVLLPLSETGLEIKEGMSPYGVELSGFYTSAGCIAEIGNYDFIVSENFSHWVVWNGSGREGFVSVEPENGPVNGLRKKGACAVIEAGAHMKFIVMIRRRNT